MKTEYGFNAKDIIITSIICISLLLSVFMINFYSYQSLLIKRNAFEICLMSSMKDNTLTNMAEICKGILDK